uniref:uncharacterized protein n=1 Tax=Semicossyphus pulcher TaxID=241346 RepID=UPI0037E996EB
MAAPGFRREKYLVTVGIFRYNALPRPGRVLRLIVTNLRNRPLSSSSVNSMRDVALSLYHNLVTGSRDFPQIPSRGFFAAQQLFTPFPVEEQKENASPSPLEAPSGLMVPPAGSAPPDILTPGLPERAELEALRGDRRHFHRRLVVDRRTVSRFVSPVYRSDSSQLTNRWRVSDYTADGLCIMSVLCRFTSESIECVKRPTKRRRDTEGSSLPPAGKRLRL